MASRARPLFESSSFPPVSPTCYILTRIESLDLSPPSSHLNSSAHSKVPHHHMLRTDGQRPAFQGGRCVQPNMIGAEATPVKRPGTGVCDATCSTVIEAAPEPSRCPPAGPLALPPPGRWLQSYPVRRRSASAWLPHPRHRGHKGVRKPVLQLQHDSQPRHRPGIRPRGSRALVSDPSSPELDGLTPPEVAPAIAEPQLSGRSPDACPIP